MDSDQNTMQRKIETTADGSHTIFIPELNEHYHSVNGALQESKHIFIEAGLKSINKREIRIFEVGFGTGLNALLTFAETESPGTSIQKIEYYTLEKYPIPSEITQQLNYGKLLGSKGTEWYQKLHQTEWNQEVAISPRFTIHKIEGSLQETTLPQEIDLIYFDAFAPEKQPDMWKQELFDKLFEATAPEGRIVTYCAKGAVRREMQSSGYEMERLPGPPGKRHILRGTKREIKD